MNSVHDNSIIMLNFDTYSVSASSSKASTASRRQDNRFVIPDNGLPFPYDPFRPAGMKTGYAVDYVPIAESVSASSVRSGASKSQVASHHRNVGDKILNKSIPGYTGYVPAQFTEDNIGNTFQKTKEVSSSFVKDRAQREQMENAIFNEYMTRGSVDSRVPRAPPKEVLDAVSQASSSHRSGKQPSYTKHQVVDIAPQPSRQQQEQQVYDDASSASGSWRSSSTYSKAPSHVTSMSDSNKHNASQYGSSSTSSAARRMISDLAPQQTSQQVRFTQQPPRAGPALTGASTSVWGQRTGPSDRSLQPNPLAPTVGYGGHQPRFGADRLREISRRGI